MLFLPVSVPSLGAENAVVATAQMPNSLPAQVSEGQMLATGVIYGGGQSPVPVRGSLSFELPDAIALNTNQNTDAKPNDGLFRRPGKSDAGQLNELPSGPGGAPRESFDNASEDTGLDPKKSDNLSKNIPYAGGITHQQTKPGSADVGAAEEAENLEGQMRENGAKLNEAEVQARAELEAKQKEMERQKMEMMNQMEGDWANKAPPGLLEKIMGYINFVEAKKKRLEKARAEAEA